MTDPDTPRLPERLYRRLGEAVAWLARRPKAGAAILLGVLFLTSTAFLSRSLVDRALTTTVRRGDLAVRLSVSGIVKPAQSITYRSPLAGREAEIVFLVPEGTLVGEGDLLVRIDTTEIQRELERSVQDQRQARVDLQIAEVERQEGLATIDSLSEGEAALGIEEVRASLRRAEKKTARLREEYEGLKPLLERGFITRDELEKSAFELEEAEADLELARRKSQIQVDRTHPRDQRRARLQLAQKEAQAENARARLRETTARLEELGDAIEKCSIHARAAGLVVLEEFLGANPRRKIRAGDRVTGSQGIVTIPEVARMLVEASVPEADVHRVRAGQRAEIGLDAFPSLRLTGAVGRVGTLARASAERPWEEKRFDLVVEIDASNADLRPEMTARVDVLVGERKGVLLLPVNAVFDRQGVLVAHLVHAFRVETRPVELGQSNELLVEVLAGLREGDRVSLQDVASGAAPATPKAPPAVSPQKDAERSFRVLEPASAPLAPR